MTYYQKFDMIRTNLRMYCKERIEENWGSRFDMWLKYDAMEEFGQVYQNILKKEFSEYIDSEMERLFFISGKNIAFAIITYIKCDTLCTLEDVLQFTDQFIEEQLDDFDNWCDEIGTAMYDESSESQGEYEG